MLFLVSPEAALEYQSICCQRGHVGRLRDTSLICSKFVMTKADMQGNKYLLKQKQSTGS